MSSAIKGCSHVCHQAALGSVPRSIENPILTNDINIGGSLNLLFQSVENSIERFVYASSSSVYGDNLEMPKREENTGRPLSPYAVTKSALEQYSRVFNDIYEIDTIGLRYFNVFGPGQFGGSAYSTAISAWCHAVKSSQPLRKDGTGEQSRDLCYVDNVVDANIFAMQSDKKFTGQCYNIACGDRTSNNEILDYFTKQFQVTEQYQEKFFSQFPKLANKEIIAFPGRLSSWKGQESFIKLISNLPDNYSGLIVGPYEDCLLYTSPSPRDS